MNCKYAMLVLVWNICFKVLFLKVFKILHLWWQTERTCFLFLWFHTSINLSFNSFNSPTSLFTFLFGVNSLHPRHKHWQYSAVNQSQNSPSLRFTPKVWHRLNDKEKTVNNMTSAIEKIIIKSPQLFWNLWCNHWRKFQHILQTNIRE